MRDTGFPVKVTDIEHIKVCGSEDTYCGHPRQGGMHYFGNGEIALIHNHAPCAYQQPGEAGHGEHGYHGRAQVLLQRSLDCGRSWPVENNVVIFDHSRPLSEQRAFLFPPAPAQRPEMNLLDKNSLVFVGWSWAGDTSLRSPRPGVSQYTLADEVDHEAIMFALRSADKGCTWEKHPWVFAKPDFATWLWGFNQPPVVMPDGSLLLPLTTPEGIMLYGSDDDGLSWIFLGVVAVDPYKYGRVTYAHIIMLPSGRLQCYMYGMGAYTCLLVCHSDDGYSWSTPRPIVRWGHSPWREMRRKRHESGFLAPRASNVFYRSPWAMQLKDGRLLVLFNRRVPPCGIGGIVSEDAGESWSDEFILRSDAFTGDIGYPVAVQFEDDRIFTAYYYSLGEPHTRMGGPRFLAGTYFTLK